MKFHSLSFRKNDYESAMFHFQLLLKNKPDYWVALARLVEVMRRTGKRDFMLEKQIPRKNVSFRKCPSYPFSFSMKLK